MDMYIMTIMNGNSDSNWKRTLPKLGRTKETGTCINFLPDPEIFEKTRFSATDVKSRLHETAYLNPELTIVLKISEEQNGKRRIP